MFLMEIKEILTSGSGNGKSLKSLLVKTIDLKPIVWIKMLPDAHLIVL
jgi:hypothetical protein